jgi:hypothetical protein
MIRSIHPTIINSNKTKIKIELDEDFIDDSDNENDNDNKLKNDDKKSKKTIKNIKIVESKKDNKKFIRKDVKLFSINNDVLENHKTVYDKKINISIHKNNIGWLLD